MAAAATTELRQSRTSSLSYLAITLVFAAVVAARQHALGAAPPWPLMAALAIAAAGFAALALRPRYLRADTVGFTIGGGYAWRPQRVIWRDVATVEVCEPGRGSRAVAVHFRTPTHDPSHLADDPPARRAMLILQGWDEAPEAMAETLETLRKQAAEESA